MPVSAAFNEYVRDLFEPLGEVSVRRMFGGAGYYLHGAMFALAVDDVLYLKVDAETEDAFAAAGAEGFAYQIRDGSRVMTSYRRLPEEITDAPEEVLAWGRLAMEAALRKKAGSSGRRRRGPLLISGPWDEE